MKTGLAVAILGAGAWGSTLAQLLAENGHQVRVWSRRSSDPLATVLAEVDVVISAVAMQGVRSVVQQVQSIAIAPHTIFLTATKGLDVALQPSPSYSSSSLPRICTPAQIWQTTFPDHPIVVLSGPNLSQEIRQGLPAAAVAASLNQEAAKFVQSMFTSTRFRVYTNPDPCGVELGGTLKNVIAIAAGACDGLRLGTNAKAALVTRGLAEMIRIGQYWGAQVETFYGLAGLGDLLATCNSCLSRNYQVGFHLAEGHSLTEILKQLQGTAEGVNTSQVLMQLAHNPELVIPISYQVVRLLKRETTPQAAVEALMLRDAKSESEAVDLRTKISEQPH